MANNEAPGWCPICGQHGCTDHRPRAPEPAEDDTEALARRLGQRSLADLDARTTAALNCLSGLCANPSIGLQHDVRELAGRAFRLVDAALEEAVV